MQNLETNITGGFFLAAAAMLYFGWILLPAKIGSYFEIKDFAAVRLKRRLWIWLYRLYLFGYVAGVMAFVALATLVTESAARILVWPAVVVLDAGLVMTALAYAFYYHFGAWGSMDMEGKSDDEIQEFIAKLRVSTEYITCWVRFGQIFIGVGQLVFVLGLLMQAGPWPMWLIIAGAILGVAGIGLTLEWPDNLDYYKPLFYLDVLWLAIMGIALLTLI
jgi:hypothetical protein